MTAKKLIAAIKAHKGPIYCGVCLRDDVAYVQVAKTALLAAIGGTGFDDGLGDNQAYVSVHGATMYFHNC